MMNSIPAIGSTCDVSLAARSATSAATAPADGPPTETLNATTALDSTNDGAAPVAPPKNVVAGAHPARDGHFPQARARGATEERRGGRTPDQDWPLPPGRRGLPPGLRGRN